MARVEMNYSQREMAAQSSTTNRSARNAEEKSDTSAKKAGDSIYGGELNLGGVQDEIAKKQAMAGKEALKTILDTFGSENAVDRELQERAGHMDELKEEISGNIELIEDVEEQQEALKQNYNIEPDDEEQQDLELLRKRRDSLKDPGIKLTDEEKKRVAMLDERGYTEYQEGSLELDERKAAFSSEIKDAKKQWKEDNATIKAVHKARLKTHNMVDAKKEAEEIQQQVKEEVQGLLIKDAVEEQDEKLEEIKKRAEERAEKEEEEQPSGEMEVRSAGQGTIDQDVQKDVLQAKVEELLMKQKITEEDVKGLDCDERV